MIQWVGFLSALKPFGGHVDPLDTVVVREVLGHDNDACKLAQLASHTFKGAMVVKKEPSQDVLHGDEAEEELGLARLVSSYTLPRQNSQPGKRGRQAARSKVLSRRARNT